MRFLLSVIFVFVSLNATVYFAKVEPLQKYSIKSAVSGKVLSTLQEQEGRLSSGKVILHLDDILNKKDLKSSIEQLDILEKMVRLTEKNLKNAQKVAKIREQNYDKIKNLRTKSRVEKDNTLINSVNAQNQALSLMNNLENLKSQLNAQRYKISVLKDTINKKSIRVPKGYLIYKIYLQKGDFAGMGSPLVDAYDISMAKLTIFVSKEDYDLAKSGVIYMDGKKTNYRVNKLWKSADTQNISSYKAEILIPAPNVFSKLVKIEFKAK